MSIYCIQNGLAKVLLDDAEHGFYLWSYRINFQVRIV